MDLPGFGHGGCGPAFGPISMVEILDWTGPFWEFCAWIQTLFQPNAEVWAFRRGYCGAIQDL